MQTQSLNIDLFVGKKIRLKRKILGMSQKNLGDALGVSFQQIQKYEKGLNRVSAGRLKEISDILNVPVSFFTRISSYISSQTKTPRTLMKKLHQAKRNFCF